MQDSKQLLKQFLQEPVYQTAFVHRSYLNENPSIKASNERLEFLGDSVLSLVVSTHLYNKRLDDDEGKLTNLRSYIVKTTSLAKAAEKLELGKYLLMSKGEELSGGRENPQLLANTYEALLGAIYLDKGFKVSSEFVYKSLMPLFEEELLKGAPKDAKSNLQELSQAKYKLSPVYKMVSATGPDHARIFKVAALIGDKLSGEGVGISKQLAEEAAAGAALREIESH